MRRCAAQEFNSMTTDSIEGVTLATLRLTPARRLARSFARLPERQKTAALQNAPRSPETSEKAPVPRLRIRVNLTGDPESFLEPAPACVLKSLGRCLLWRSPMLSSALGSGRVWSTALQPAPDTHLSAIVHRGRAATTFPLTPALSPRRGRPFGRPRSIRASSVFDHLLHLRIPTAARGRGLLGWPQSGRGFSLSPRERDRVRGKRTNDGPMTFPSPKCVSGEGFSAAPLPAPTSTPEGRRVDRTRCSTGCERRLT